MLLRRDIIGKTAWHLAGYRGELDIMQEIRDLAKEKLATEEIKNELLLRTYNGGSTARYLAASWGEANVIREIWVLSTEKLTTEEIKMKCYYVQTMREGTPGILQQVGASQMKFRKYSRWLERN
jgi:hypothetical protein